MMITQLTKKKENNISKNTTNASGFKKSLSRCKSSKSFITIFFAFFFLCIWCGATRPVRHSAFRVNACFVTLAASADPGSNILPFTPGTPCLPWHCGRFVSYSGRCTDRGCGCSGAGRFRSSPWFPPAPQHFR
jgi:hypothetical protein